MKSKIIYSVVCITFLTIVINSKQVSAALDDNTGAGDTSVVNLKKYKEGIVFYAIGSNPAWTLDIGKNGSLIFNEINGMSINIDHTKGEKAMDANVTRYAGKSDRGFFSATISEGGCSVKDIRENFNYKVNIEINNPGDKNYKKFGGCGTYVPDYKLGRKWILQKMGTRSVSADEYKNGLPELMLQVGRNDLIGSTGCNNLMGAFTAENNAIRFMNIECTIAPCPDINKEKEFLSALNKADNYKITGNELFLSGRDKLLMVLYDTSAHTNTDIDLAEDSLRIYRLYDIWVLENINGLKTDEKNYMNGLPRLEINTKEMTFLGTGGCNNINGKLEASGDHIKFGNVVSTRMMCPGNHEADFLNSLQSADRFKIENGKLYLMIDDKVVLTLKKID